MLKEKLEPVSRLARRIPFHDKIQLPNIYVKHYCDETLFLEGKKNQNRFIFLFLHVSDGVYFDQGKPHNILSENIQPVLEMGITVARAMT